MTLLPDFPGTAHPHLAVAADKSGRIYLVDQDNMGGFNPGGPDRVLQEFMANPHGLIYSSPAYFDGKVYIQGVGDVLKAFALKLDPATNTMMLDETPVSQGTTVSGFPGSVQSVSADGTSNGIVWDPQVDGFATGGPAILRAYNANDLSTPLYSQQPGRAARHGRRRGQVHHADDRQREVYLGTQFEVDVYGLLPRAGGASHSVGTPAGTEMTPERGVLAAGAHRSRIPCDFRRRAAPAWSSPVVNIAAATPAGPATTRISRAAAAPIVASNSGPRAGGGAQPLVALSGNGLTTLHDLAISALDGDNGLVSLPGLKKDRSGHRTSI